MFRSLHNDYHACIIAACLIRGPLERLETACESLCAQIDAILLSGNFVRADERWRNFAHIHTAEYAVHPALTRLTVPSPYHRKFEINSGTRVPLQLVVAGDVIQRASI